MTGPTETHQKKVLEEQDHLRSSVQISKPLPPIETLPAFFSSRLLSRFLPASSLPRHNLIWRWLSFSFASLATYVLLDRSTTELQLWHGISAWYPPVGFAFALFVGLGDAAILSMFLAGFLSGLINYHQSPISLEFLLINPLVPTLYLLAARSVKKRLTGDLRVHSMRDVLMLLGYSAGISGISAFAGTAILSFSGNVPAQDYLRASFNWWIGDAVALSSISLFLLEFVLPRLRHFLGISSASSPSFADRSSSAPNADSLLDRLDSWRCHRRTPRCPAPL